MIGKRRWLPSGITCPGCGEPTKLRVDDDTEYFEVCTTCKWRIDYNEPRPTPEVRQRMLARVRSGATFKRRTRDWATLSQQAAVADSQEPESSA